MKKLYVLLALALAPCALATTYKWVDEQGHVHYADTPPAGAAYEIVAPPHPVPAPPPSVTMPATVSPEAAVPPPAPTTEVVTTPAPDDGKCVDALYQIELLNEKRRAFKPGPNDSRIYIEDRDRPAEIERLGRERDANCSSEPELRQSEQLRADRLRQTLSPDCQSARENLEDALSPSTRTPDSEIERHRTYLQDHCPGPGRTDLWMADWMFVRRRVVY
jgi:hypothetical protein